MQPVAQPVARGGLLSLPTRRHGEPPLLEVKDARQPAPRADLFLDGSKLPQGRGSPIAVVESEFGGGRSGGVSPELSLSVAE